MRVDRLGAVCQNLDVDGGTDEELLSAWKSGETDAGARLFDRHYEALSRFFRNKVDDTHRDDIVQQTFMSLPNAAFDGRSTVKTWVFAIAWRRLCDHYRSQARRNKHQAAVADMSVLELGSTPETRYVKNEERRLLLEGLRRLPLHQQAVLELHYWEDMPLREIASVLDIPLGTAKTRLRDGRCRLATILEEIAQSTTILRSTLDDLDGWARRARELTAIQHVPPAKQ